MQLNKIKQHLPGTNKCEGLGEASLERNVMKWCSEQTNEGGCEEKTNKMVVAVFEDHKDFGSEAALIIVSITA